MAGRKKRRAAVAHAAPSNRGTDGWANLPDGILLSVIDRLPSVADLFAVAAVCRSWRVLSRSSAPAAGVRGGRPPLLLTPFLEAVESGRWRFRRSWHAPRRCRLLSPAAPAASHRCLVSPSTLAGRFLGYSFGRVIFCRGRRVLLADAVTGHELRPPELPPDCARHDYGVLTAPLSSPDCSLLLLNSAAVLLRWRVGERAWSAHPLGKDTAFITRVSVFKGQIFGLDDCGRFFRLEFSPDFSVRQLAVRWAGELSRLPNHLPFASQLVDCGDELMVVRFVMADMLCAKVEVSRLDFSDPPSLVKVESLGDRALFIDAEHGSSVSCTNPGGWGGRSNCIYFAGRGSDTWTVLPVDGGAVIDVTDPESAFSMVNYSLPRWPSPIWVYPSMLY